jgi:hypothetical protein
MASELQRAANLKNATLSTGPSSPGGKLASSANSRKHGLSGRLAGVDPARAGEAEAMRDRYLDDLRPASAEGRQAVGVMVAMTLRIDDCRAALLALADQQAEEAATDWDHARKVDAEATAEGLRRRPGSASARLGETRQGAELMLGRWESLRRSLDRGTWDESDRATALDLLGVDRALRKPGQTALDGPEGADATAGVGAVIEAEVARLRSRLATTLARADARSRAEAGTALGVLLSKPAALIFRYEREAERRFNAALKVALASPRDESPPAARDPAPASIPAPAAWPGPEPARVPAVAPAEAGDVARLAVLAFAEAEVVAVAAPTSTPRPLNRRARRAQAARLRRAGR